MQTAAAPRRTLATRNAAWAHTAAHALARAGATPDGVSLAGVAMAVLAAFAFALAPDASPADCVWLFVGAAAAIQLRLLCNLLDGMLAVEEGLKTPTGDIYNDLPDRIADVLILAAAGYGIGVPSLGWTAAVCALLTAYARVLAGSLRATQRFIGPMAKQHRMFTLTVAAILAAAEARFALPPRAIAVALVVIAAGSIVTAIRRTRLLAAELESR
jgi:phosphatidylglycerophosphate synthase